MKKDNLIICTVLLLSFLALCSGLQAQSFRLSGASDLVRIFEDGYRMPTLTDTVEMFGIRGEIISGQCVIQSGKSLTKVSCEVSPMKNISTGTFLPAGSVEWNFVGSIPLKTNAPNQPVNSLTRVAPASFPDYLMEDKQLDVKENSCKSIYLTAKIPSLSMAGLYSGKLKVKCQQGEQSIPVAILVNPLTLPAERHLKVAEWYFTNNFEALHGIKETYSAEWFGMLKKYAENMVEHRQNVFTVPLNAVEILKTSKGELEFDFRRFDQIAQVFWDTKKMDMMETGEVSKFGPKGWSDTDIVLKDYSVKTSETGEKITLPGSEVIPSLVQALENHLRQKGWLDKTMFHIKDEPSLHNSRAYSEVSSFVHRYAPDLIRGEPIETSNVLNDLEIAIPKLDVFAAHYDLYEKARQNGTEIWFYTVGIYQGSQYPNKTVDMPLIDNRLMHWLNYKYNATGFLHWGWNHWTANPFEDADKHLGDGWHVYPTKDGVLNSIRWEQMRNGIQDYEYLWMLESGIKALKDSLGSNFSWINPSQRGKEIAGRVIQGFAEHTDDPAVLVGAKNQLINDLIQLNTHPALYIQTNPIENSALTSRTSVEVKGWTEPGTKITVNGQELPVSSQGLFMEQFPLTVKKMDLKIQAVNVSGTKEIIRVYNVK